MAADNSVLTTARIADTQAETAELAQPELARDAPPRREKIGGLSGHWTLNLIGVGLILALCDYAETVLVVTLVAALIAFILAPVVDVLTYIKLPRGLASAIAVALLLTVVGGVIYFSSNQALIFSQDLPKYTTRVREEVMRFRKQAETLEVLPPQHEKGVVVSVRPATDWAEILASSFGPGEPDDSVGFLRSVSHLLHADLAATCPLRHGDAVPA